MALLATPLQVAPRGRRTRAPRCPAPRHAAGAPSSVVTDDSVPEGHAGLHEYLYGGGSEAEHAATAYNIREGEDDGSALVPLASWVEARELEKPLGVYAVYNSAKDIQYVGYSRNVVTACRAHLAKLGPEVAAHVRVMVFANKAMATRTHMEREVSHWVQAVGAPPPGNTEAGAADWDLDAGASRGGGGSGEELTAAERAAHEAKKLKLRKAMGENLADEVPGETLEQKARRLAMLKAVEGDDWSELIARQTSEALGEEDGAGGAAAARAEGGGEEPVVSPFEGGGAGGAAAAPAEQLELNVDNVEMVLEAVRPYLIADGGNISVKGLEGGVLSVELEGACGTCPSSTTTMKMGVERRLQEAFGDQLKEVVQVNALDTSASVASVDAHLDLLRPAIKNYGGSVEVLAVEGGKCELRFDGPKPLAAGIQSALKDKFPDIGEVVWHGLD